MKKKKGKGKRKKKMMGCAGCLYMDELSIRAQSQTQQWAGHARHPKA
jgi:hypothetical protein